MAAPPLAVVSLASMRRTDLPQVLAIEAGTSPRPWLLNTFMAELNRADRRYLVARSVVPGSADGSGRDPGGGAARGGGGTGGGAEGARVVGFAGVALFPHEAHVMTVAVDPSSQGRGIGARLVTGMLEEVARVGLEAVTLEVREGNVAARRLYRRAGFGEAGVRPGYYPDGEGAVIMWRRRGVEVS